MNAVTYLRYSDAGQSESSIEAQRIEVESFAQRNGYTIIREYVDRAQTATTDNRPAFQRMIADSERRQFEAILVYQLDRFARDRYDSAHNKAKLKKNGVRVISVKENITDDPSGILLESVLEGYAEFFSKDLSMKTRRGMGHAADQARYLGSRVLLGYAINSEKKYELDMATAPIVRDCFDLAAGGMKFTEIGKRITEKYSTNGKPYFKNSCNSLRRMLSNEFYTGTYNIAGRHLVNSVPRLVSDEQYAAVQVILERNKKAPARARAVEAEFLLTTKLFCGLCGESMFGVSGTSSTGKTHHYYSCKKRWQKRGCTKSYIRKDIIEQHAVSLAKEQLTDENIEIIVKEVCDMSKKDTNTLLVADLKKKLREVNKALERLLDAIEQGEHLDLISERISKKKTEKAEIELALSNAEIEIVAIDESAIRFFLNHLRQGKIDNEAYNRALINIFIQAIYLFDDKFRIIFSATGKPIEVDYEFLPDETSDDGYTETNEASNTNVNSRSYMNACGVPSETL